MRKKIAEISGAITIIGICIMILANLMITFNFYAEEGYLLWAFGIVISIMGAIPYLFTGEKPRDWFWDMLDWF